MQVRGEELLVEVYPLGYTLQAYAYALGVRSTEDGNAEYMSETIVHYLTFNDSISSKNEGYDFATQPAPSMVVTPFETVDNI